MYMQFYHIKYFTVKKLLSYTTDSKPRKGKYTRPGSNPQSLQLIFRGWNIITMPNLSLQNIEDYRENLWNKKLYGYNNNNCYWQLNNIKLVSFYYDTIWMRANVHHTHSNQFLFIYTIFLWTLDDWFKSFTFTPLYSPHIFIY